MNDKKMQVRCPYCGYKMPVYYGSKADCKGVHVTCKGRNCKKEFEIRIEKGQTVK